MEIVFGGTDAGVLDKTPDYLKSLPLWKAMDENTLIAFAMNGAPLPHWHGFPARLVVPGWTATHWMKHLSSIEAVTQPHPGFWMKTAYRIPKGKFPVVDRFISQEGESNTPITEMVVNSLVTNLEAGQRLGAGKPLEVRGIAWDGGYGIARVEVSTDAGKSWRGAELGQDLGRFAWRQWRYRTPAPLARGRHVVMVRASNRVGGTQTPELIQNPAGYHHNVVQQLQVQVA